MNKKLTLILVFALLLAFVLSACGGSNDTETETETDIQTDTETNTETETETDTETDTETNTETNTETDTNSDTSSNEIEYSVKVVNYKGEPISSGLFIQILKDGEELGSMKKANKEGTATFTLEKGSYTFEIIYTATDSDKITYDANECVLSTKKPSKEIMLYNVETEGSMLIYPYDADEGDRYEYSAKFVSEGANKVAIDGISYYVFHPKRGGVYKFSYICDVAITFGYFGESAHYVYESGETELVDRAFEKEVKESSIVGGGGTVILGVKSKATDSCFITIERIRDEEKPIEQIEYTAKEVPSSVCKYNYLNMDLVALDITSEDLTVVYNEEDGYYHLNTVDGPLVLVKISVPSRFMTSFTEICENTKLFKIESDASGKPFRMEVYNELFSKYAKKCDKTGVVPLNKELEYVIKNILEQQEWYGEQNIFKYPDTIDENNNVIEGEKIYVPEENAWLFPCCYMLENDKGTEETKILVNDTIDPESYLVRIDADETLYLKASNDRKATLTILNAQQIKVKVNGVDKEYTADENGKIEILLETIPYVYEDEETGEMTDGVYPIEFSILNEGEETLDLEFTYVTKL